MKDEKTVKSRASHTLFAERTEDICEKQFKGTAITSLRAGETHSDEITERDQKKSLCAPKPKETEDI